MRATASFAVAVLSMAAMHAAQAAVVGQAQASISNFSYSLNDLQPGDGVTPSFTVISSLYGGQTNVLKYRYTPTRNLDLMESDQAYHLYNGSPSTNLFSPYLQSSGLPSGDGRADITADGFSTAVTLNSTDVGGAKYQHVDRIFDRFWIGGTEVMATVFSASERWVLSPGTELMVSGTMKLQSSVDAEALAGLTQGKLMRADGRATAQTRAYALVDYPDLEIITSFPRADDFYAVDTHEYLSPLGSLGKDHAQGSLEQTFSFTIRNRHYSAVDLYFDVSIAAWAAATPVPEPSSIALMFAGVGVVAWRGQRRRLQG